MVAISPVTREGRSLGGAYAWSGFATMWAFWVCFVVFLAEPRALMSWWPLPTIDRAEAPPQPQLAAITDLLLMALFGLQHSLMARPWFKQRFMRRLPDAFERCTYVHMANLALFTLILCWQPISGDVWRLDNGSYRHTLWLLFTAG